MEKELLEKASGNRMMLKNCREALDKVLEVINNCDKNKEKKGKTLVLINNQPFWAKSSVVEEILFESKIELQDRIDELNNEFEAL